MRYSVLEKLIFRKKDQNTSAIDAFNKCGEGRFCVKMLLSALKGGHSIENVLPFACKEDHFIEKVLPFVYKGVHSVEKMLFFAQQFRSLHFQAFKNFPGCQLLCRMQKQPAKPTAKNKEDWLQLWLPKKNQYWQ